MSLVSWCSTWLGEYLDGVQDVHTVTLSGNDQAQLLECLCLNQKGVALGR